MATRPWLWRLLLACLVAGLSACGWVMPGPVGTATPRVATGLAPVSTVEVRAPAPGAPSVVVVARGSLPEACTRLSGVQQSYAAQRFEVKLFTVTPLDHGCAPVITSFEQPITLTVAGLPAGRYTVDVNGVGGAFTLGAATPPG